MFRELIYASNNWAAQAHASRLQQAWCQWSASERDEFLVYGKGDVLGLVNLATGYPELERVYLKYMNDEYIN